MKRNYKKANTKKRHTVELKVLARVFEIAYRAGVYDAGQSWTDEHTKKMQERFEEFVSNQTKDVPTK